MKDQWRAELGQSRNQRRRLELRCVSASPHSAEKRAKSADFGEFNQAALQLMRQRHDKSHEF
jgi:hypothetical protein